MAKKTKTFAEKALGKNVDSPVCPTCGEVYSPVLVVDSEKNGDKKHWKFTRSIVKVCKCNEQSVFA